MFQTIGHNLIPAIAKCLNVPLVTGKLTGKSFQRDLDYFEEKSGDEVEDMFNLLQEVILQFPQVQAVSCGAILSDYQRNRVENVCTRLKLTSLAYLWK